MSGLRANLLVWLALLMLLAATTGGAYLPIGRFNIALALTIAAIKAALVLIGFMRLWEGPRLARVFAVAGFFWLGILLWLAGGDYLTRHGFPPG